MTISRRGGATDNYNPDNVGGFTWPSGVSANDFAIVVVSYYENSGANTPTAPTGFTERANIAIAGTGNEESRVVVYTRDCDGTETGSLALNFSPASVYAGAALTVLTGDGELTYNSISTADTGNSSDATTPSVSGTSGQGLIAVYGLSDPPGTTNSGPSGMTLADAETSVTNSVAIYYQTLSSTGATGSKTWDFTNTRNWGGYSILIDEAGGGAASNPHRASMLLGIG